MSREIKFRAWHNGRNKWIEADKMVIAYGKVYLDWRCFEDGIEANAILMQYTGLHDKNGREIYEGDIVLQHLEMGKVERTVTWDNVYLGFCLLDRNDRKALILPEYIEVIGNIYEGEKV